MNILIFGPNGSGKGTQSAILKEKYQLEHIESGGIFREHIGNRTDLGKEAKKYIDEGKLVPDSITIPMVLDRLKKVSQSGKNWILDGFPRNPSQASALFEGLEKEGMELGAIIVIELAREIAKSRLMGRRACPEGHPNNTAIPVISPVEKEGNLCCWKCGTPVTCRADDTDEEAIDVRLDIYFDDKNGTVGSIAVMEELSGAKEALLFIRVDGSLDIKGVSASIKEALGF